MLYASKLWNVNLNINRDPKEEFCFVETKSNMKLVEELIGYKKHLVIKSILQGILITLDNRASVNDIEYVYWSHGLIKWMNIYVRTLLLSAYMHPFHYK